MFLKVDMMLELLTLVICGALLLSIDLLNLVLGLRYNVKKFGPSGIPVVPVCVYALFCIATWRTPLIINMDPKYLFKIFDFAALAVFHIFCMYLIPCAHRRWIRGGDQNDNC